MPDDGIDFDSSADPLGIPPEHVEAKPNGAHIPPAGLVPLGYDRGVFFYLSLRSLQITALTPEGHTRMALTGIASLPHYWQRSRFATDKGEIRWHEAADWLMTCCVEVGIYDPERVRGRGAWFDAGRSVLHLGDHLLVDGEPSDLMLPKSRYVYQAALSLGIEHDGHPLSTHDAHQLCEITSALRWEKPVYGTLLAGWCVAALICGALRWRPSVWLTGAAASGKSWCQDNVLAPVVGPVALQVQSKTSEAGIRQALNSDALPVIFDEFEREDSSAAVRVQGVLDLMRQASSESEKRILKGTAGQAVARSFRVRSCFCFSSINVGTAHAADESRLTVLSLRPPEQANGEAQEAFQALMARAEALLTPEYAAALLARSVRLLGVIRQNAETFAVAVAKHMGSRRQGDQLGTLLAGAYSLYSERAITAEEAAEYLRRQDWGETSGGDVQRDEARLLDLLLSSRFRTTAYGGAPQDMQVVRLIGNAIGEKGSAFTAERELQSRGVRLRWDANHRCDGIFVSATHREVGKLLTLYPQWASHWTRTLARLPGAVATGSMVVRFGPGHQARAVFLPADLLDL